MMLGFLAAMALLAQDEMAARAAYDAEARAMVERTRAETDCVRLMRPAGETVAACTERRVAALVGYPLRMLPAVAGDARRRCDETGLLNGETPGACIDRTIGVLAQEDDLFGDELRINDTPVASDAEAPAPDRRCRREIGGDADSGTAWVGLSCGDKEEADRSRALLNDMLTPND